MIAYILKSSLSLILLFGLYWFLLRKEKLFNFNRFFLIFSLIFSLVIPFISIRVDIQDHKVERNLITSLNSNIAVFSQNPDPISKISYLPNTETEPSGEKLSSGISYTEILLILYASGVILFLIRFVRNIFFISHQKRMSEKITYSGQKLILIDHQINPFCFLNAIFVNKQDFLNNNIARELLTHELEHINQSHSIDVIFIELIQIIYWFNPVLILYNRAIRVNHEYLADSGVIQTSPDVKSYANNLINFISCKKNIPMTSGFNPSLTRKRLLMLTKSGSSKINYSFRIFLTSFLVAVFFLILSCIPSNSQPITLDKQSDGNIKKTQVIKDIDGNEYQTVRIGTQTWMSENLKTTKYNDGTGIPLVTDGKKWQEFTPAYCWYNNDETQNKNKYGALYNWYAVNTKKLCPTGWHVPSNDEIFSSFFKYLNPGGLSYEDGGEDLLKAILSTDFKPIPAGSRNFSDGIFNYAEKHAYWWSSTALNNYVADGWAINFENVVANPYFRSKREGYSVRCIKNYSIEEMKALKSQKDSILNTSVAADFTGKWQLKQSQLFKGQTSSKITIVQSGNNMGIKGAFDFIDKKPIKEKLNYTLDGQTAIIKSGQRKQKVSANWSDNKRSFVITSEKFSLNGGSLEGSKCIETFSLGSDGKSLMVSYDDNINPQWYQYIKE